MGRDMRLEPRGPQPGNRLGRGGVKMGGCGFDR